MTSNRRAVTLNDAVMGKKGIRYTLSEMVTILTHYNITPAHQQHRGKKIILFQQLHRLDHDKGGLTRWDRRRILSGQISPTEGPPGASSTGQEHMEDSEVEEVAELPTAVIQLERSIIPYISQCSVCFETYPRRRFPGHRMTAECNHEPIICFDCLTLSIDRQIGSRAWDKISCPLCPMKLSFETVKAYSSAQHFEKYDRYATLHALRGIPKFCMCLGPGCDSGQVHACGNRQPIMTCNACHFKTCFTHQMPWHEDMTCTEYDKIRRQQNEENESSLAVLRKVGLTCPSCSLPGIKVSGCDHITCPQCLHEYCSRCFASYKEIQTEGNTAHMLDCPYHSSRLPSNAMVHPAGFLGLNGTVLPWQDEEEGEEEESDTGSDVDSFTDSDLEASLEIMDREGLLDLNQRLL